jgi:hypothetical protein
MGKKTLDDAVRNIACPFEFKTQLPRHMVADSHQADVYFCYDSRECFYKRADGNKQLCVYIASQKNQNLLKQNP